MYSKDQKQCSFQSQYLGLTYVVEWQAKDFADGENQENLQKKDAEID